MSKTPKHKLLSVSSSRADVNILRPVWDALIAADKIELHLFLTGMHMAHGGPEPDLPAGPRVHRGGADMGGRRESAGAAMGAITVATSELLSQLNPDGMLVIGDRLDMVPAALAAMPFNLPIAHLHGGEETKGAIDNRVRHALSQIATLHLASSQGAQDRLVAMGIPADEVLVTGAPGLDTLLNTPEIALQSFSETVGLPANLPFVLLTVHPETAGADPIAPLDACLAGLEAWHGAVLVTAPNSDPRAAEIRARLEREAAEQANWAFVDTLGRSLFPNALRHAAFMLGNSSSGLIEAGLFGLPVIDVGDRQMGRERGRNVIHTASDSEAVARAIGGLESGGVCPYRYNPGTPYGDGRSGPRIARAIEDWLNRVASE